jgi:general L-amino acid transport system substrate-binding protein
MFSVILRKNLLFCVFFSVALAISSGTARAATLDQVKQRGYLNCGSSQGLPGFGLQDDNGNWTGFDVDFCRAVAAAIFDDPSKVKFLPLTAKDRFTALQSGEVDLLAHNTTWTLSREAGQGLLFTAVNFYDGQGFLGALCRTRQAQRPGCPCDLAGDHFERAL